MEFIFGWLVIGVGIASMWSRFLRAERDVRDLQERVERLEKRKE